MFRARPPRSRAVPPRASRGYTMVELLIVMSLVGILAGLALPKYDPTPSRADAAMRLVRGALQQAQRMAIQHQHDMIVSFDIPGRRIRVAEDSTNDAVADEVERARWIPLDEHTQFVAPPQAVPGSVGTAAVSGSGVEEIEGMPSVTFRRNGAASGDLAVYVSAQRPGRTELRAVTVIRSTGRTDWFRRASGVWRQGEL